MSMISCTDVWKVYSAPDAATPASSAISAALRSATFDVETGECFVIMGLSGSGKSTLIRCMTRLIEPSRGTINIDGHDLTKASPGKLNAIRRKAMGMVFQHFALLPHLTVLDNIAFPLEVRGVDLGKRRTRASELAAMVGLTGREGHFPKELSGGQQQRVGIARALASDPEILFLDEPFSALDPPLRREMQTEFLRLRRQLNKTIVFITHDFDEAIRLADRIAIMKDGEILEIGTPEELLVHSTHSYIREFTRHADLKNVLRVRTLAKPLTGDDHPQAFVSADALVSEVAAQVMSSLGPVAVIDGATTVGIINAKDVLRVLIGEDIHTLGRAH